VAPKLHAHVVPGQHSPKKLKKIKRLEPWVEITVEDGKTVIRLYPSNEQLIKNGQKDVAARD
jgi:hypothetical protein